MPLCVNDVSWSFGKNINPIQALKKIQNANQPFVLRENRNQNANQPFVLRENRNQNANQPSVLRENRNQRSNAIFSCTKTTMTENESAATRRAEALGVDLSLPEPTIYMNQEHAPWWYFIGYDSDEDEPMSPRSPSPDVLRSVTCIENDCRPRLLAAQSPPLPEEYDSSDSEPIESDSSEPIESDSSEPIESDSDEDEPLSPRSPNPDVLRSVPCVESNCRPRLLAAQSPPLPEEYDSEPIESDSSEPIESDSSEPIESDSSEPIESDSSEPIESDSDEDEPLSPRSPCVESNCRPRLLAAQSPPLPEEYDSEPIESDSSEPIESDSSEPIESDSSEPIESDSSEPIESDSSESESDSLRTGVRILAPRSPGLESSRQWRPEKLRRLN